MFQDNIFGKFSRLLCNSKCLFNSACFSFLIKISWIDCVHYRHITYLLAFEAPMPYSKIEDNIEIYTWCVL